MISSSCIACLAHLAILYEVVCRKAPVAAETYDLCDSALQRLGVLTSKFHLEEYTYLDLLLGVRPSPYRLSVMVAQRETEIGFLGEITVGLRLSHKNPTPGRERFNAAFPEGSWRQVFRFPGQTPRLPAAVDVCFGYVGGRYHGGIEIPKLYVARGEGGVWVMIQLSSWFAFLLAYYLLHPGDGMIVDIYSLRRLAPQVSPRHS